ncbi:MAG: chemotaxis protein CheW, partial [Sphingobium sp.]
RTPGTPAQILLLDGDSATALAVDRIEGIVDEEGGDYERPDFDRLLAEGFAPVAARGGRVARVGAATSDGMQGERVALLSFAIGDQLFALPLDRIEGVTPLPRDIAKLPHADAAVVGSMAWRGETLPLLSLAVLLGLPGTPGREARVVVIRIGQHRVGLLTDKVDRLLRPLASSLDPVPVPLLRGAAETVIQAIHRPTSGGRLISVLATDRIVAEELTQVLLASADASGPQDGAGLGKADDMASLLLFESAEQRFACPLDAIHHVGRAPVKLAPVPGAPAFLLGMTGHRGEAVPVVDVSLLLSAGPVRGGKARQLIVSVGGREASLLVDRVIGVQRVSSAQITPAPPMGGTGGGIFGDVVTLDDRSEVVLLLKPDALLDNAQAQWIAALSAGSAGPA